MQTSTAVQYVNLTLRDERNPVKLSSCNVKYAL